jgi:hypothetical protein
MRRRGAVLLAVSIVLPTATGAAAASSAPVPQQVVGSSSPAVAAAPLAADVLTGLLVKGRAPKTGYKRAPYGEGWTDEDGDGCSTREEILQRDLTKKTYRRSGRCSVIATGTLADPYTGRVLAFRRGTATSSLVQIDHVVALMDSWQTGGQRLTAQRREAFANDPLNLLAVEGKVNQAKGASDAASWLPPAKGYRCTYVSRQVAVKAKYGLWVTPAEKAAVARILSGCRGQRLPV